jgi:16S rRNA (uracil1498-N3)-methyltransferase
MQIPRFFVDKNIIESSEIEIENVDVIHQVKNVLRLKEGDLIILLDGTSKEFHGKIKEIMKKKLIFSKEIMKKFSRKNEIKMKLYPAVIKKDKIEYVLQKCTELGVTEFHPIITKRTEKQNLNLERMDKIIREAAEQSGKVYLPSIDVPVSLNQLQFEYETSPEKFLNSFFLDFGGDIVNVSQIKKEILAIKDSEKNLNIFIGPEGGWDEVDKEIFAKIKIKPLSLGEQVLRAETASIAVTSLFLLGKN